jgi:hypothetical protein
MTRRGKMITSNASHSTIDNINNPRIAIMYLMSSIPAFVLSRQPWSGLNFENDLA